MLTGNADGATDDVEVGQENGTDAEPGVAEPGVAEAGGEPAPTDVLVDGEADQEADTEPAKGVDESTPAGP